MVCVMKPGEEIKGVVENFGRRTSLPIWGSASSLAELVGARLAQVNGFC